MLVVSIENTCSQYISVCMFIYMCVCIYIYACAEILLTMFLDILVYYIYVSWNFSFFLGNALFFFSEETVKIYMTMLPTFAFWRDTHNKLVSL